MRPVSAAMSVRSPSGIGVRLTGRGASLDVTEPTNAVSQVATSLFGSPCVLGRLALRLRLFFGQLLENEINQLQLALFAYRDQ